MSSSLPRTAVVTEPTHQRHCTPKGTSKIPTYFRKLPTFFVADHVPLRPPSVTLTWGRPAMVTDENWGRKGEAVGGPERIRHPPTTPTSHSLKQICVMDEPGEPHDPNGPTHSNFSKGNDIPKIPSKSFGHGQADKQQQQRPPPPS